MTLTLDPTDDALVGDLLDLLAGALKMNMHIASPSILNCARELFNGVETDATGSLTRAQRKFLNLLVDPASRLTYLDCENPDHGNRVLREIKSQLAVPAIHALAAYGRADSLPVLERVLASSPNEEARTEAAYALEHIQARLQATPDEMLRASCGLNRPEGLLRSVEHAETPDHELLRANSDS